MFRLHGWGPGAIASRRLAAAVTTILITASAPAQAAVPDGPADDERPFPVALGIEEAAQRAADASPLVRRARALRGATEARRVGASLLLPSNPAVALSLGPTRAPDENGGSTTELGVAAHVEQTVEIAGQRGTRRAEVERAVEGTLVREHLADVEARARGRATYVAALLAAAQVEAARRREELATELESSVRERVEAGAVSDIDLRLATIERGRIERDRFEFVRAAGDALGDLRALLALPPDAPLTLTTPLAAPAGAPLSLADARARAEAQRADLKALDADRSELDASIARLRREAVPSPTFFLDAERDRPGETFVRAGLSIALPVARRNEGEIARARAQLASVDVERVLGAREVAREVDRAWRDVTTRAAEVDIDDKDIVPAADSALELLTQGWRAGKFDVFRIIQASRESGDARRRALEDLGRLWQARIELDRATGTP